VIVIPQAEAKNLTTNVPDNTEPAWQSGTDYAAGDRVQYENRLYEAINAVNSNTPPDEDALNWLYVGPVNKMAMFDHFMTTATVYDQAIEVSVDVSDCDGLGLFGLYAQSVRVVLHDNTSDADVFDETYDLERYDVTDWYEWTYNVPTYRERLFVPLPMFYDATLTVTITPRGDAAKCAFMAWGRSDYLGATLYGASVSARSNTRKERSADGHVYLQKGISWRRMSVPVIVDDSHVDDVVRRLSELDGVPCMYAADPREGGYESMLIFGFYRDFDVAIDVVKSKYDIEIEGVG